MREIKFRVFDRCHKSMHIVGTDSHDNLSCFDGVVQYYNLQNGEGSGEHGDYTLMQYTGLKDKNGKEIFEGDILSTEDGSFEGTTCGIVEEHKGMFVSFYGQGFLGRDRYDELYEISKEREIIGNIYENKDLLEQDNERSS
ncbi:YopX family protein [Bacillus sp. FSL K6-3431]|uniref:YopX family protein n=1 Tax=Bacillus sp. FSL K6-3431 TaxID=2921500 RepID=UPI0030F674E6